MSGDYTIERVGSPVAKFAVEGRLPTQVTSLPPTGQPSAKFANEPDEDLGAGIEPYNPPPPHLDDVARECPFVAEAIATGGKNFANPLWNISALIAAHSANPRADAHRMADKHPDYTPETTDNLFDRKEREKAEKGIGWPSCKAISGAGYKGCQDCKHFSAGKSPLNFAVDLRQRSAAPSGAAPPGAVPPPQTRDVLPAGYVRGADGVIMQCVQDKKTGVTLHVPICEYPMMDAWLQTNPRVLHFTTIADDRERQQIALPLEIISGQGMRAALQQQGLMLQAGNKAVEILGNFFMSWIKTLQDTQKSVSSSPIGWHVDRDSGEITGFAYGGRLWTPGGSQPAALADPEIERQYTPKGQAAPWMDAAGLVTGIGRPDLDAMVSTAFGAPLVRFTGQQGLQMSVFSAASGVGKTTALKIAQGVWGDVVGGVQALSDTKNSVMNKMGLTRNLPLYWDELKTDSHVRKFVEIAFEVTGGREKARLTQNARQREAGTWQTMLVSASNESLLDQVVRCTKTTTAGLYRVFEYEVKMTSNGQISPSDAQRKLAKLNDNCGPVGLEFAKFLGANFERVDGEVGDFVRALEAELSSTSDERFWVSLMACVCMGARYANELGFTKIDEDALKRFLIATMKDMRAQRANQSVDMNDTMSVSNLLSQFLTAMRDRHTLHTDKIHTAPGKPAAGSISPDYGRFDPNRLAGVYVQYGRDDKMLRFSSSRFHTWLREEEISQTVFTEALTRKFGMKRARGRLGAGTRHQSGGAEHLFEIDLTHAAAAQFLAD
jgi:hypothetical protein